MYCHHDWKRRLKPFATALIIAFLLASAFPLISPQITVSAAPPEGDGALWKPGTFEDNVGLEYSPHSPSPDEPVNVTITSKYTPVQSASINVAWLAQDKKTGNGAYSMTIQNSTVYTGSILKVLNKYGIAVTFNVTAYDFFSKSLTSRDYSYTVTSAGGWKHANFPDNIALSYAPLKPNPYEAVNITLSGKEPNVFFNFVQINLTYQPSGETPVGPFSVDYFSTGTRTGYAVIGSDPRNTPNQPGYNVTFWVAVYDKYWRKTE